MRSARLIVAGAALASLSACSLFGGNDDEELQPAELLEFDETLDVKRVWSSSVGGGTEFLRLALTPAGDGARVYAASFDGAVNAFDAETGRRDWRYETDIELVAGPGLGANFVVVVGREGEVIALSADDGSELWRSDVSGEASAVPVVKDDIVVVSTIDGALRGLSAFDGAIRWSVEQSLPALTLRGGGAPIVVGNSVIAGFDNGRLVATNVADGTIEWEAVLSPPSGRSDLERLADVDGAIAAVGQDVYAAGYQGQLAALAAESGQVLWARDVSSYSGIGSDWSQIYAATGDGELVALVRRNGEEVWRQPALLRRQPTTPIAFSTAVVVGDFEGYLHFFSSADGSPVARARVGKGMISGRPVVVGGRLFVQNESGDLAAFEVELPEPPEADDDEAAEDG
ncbi:MAG: outer membrane protein assembly factor BamB [Pseudomonadota bacterium]